MVTIKVHEPDSERGREILDYCKERPLVECKCGMDFGIYIRGGPLTGEGPLIYVMCEHCGRCTDDYQTRDQASAAWNNYEVDGGWREDE